MLVEAVGVPAAIGEVCRIERGLAGPVDAEVVGFRGSSTLLMPHGDLAGIAPEQFDAYLSAYAEAYDVVKGNSPKTKVFPTFQLEDLEGAFGDVHPPRWDLLQKFTGRMDILAISTYPFLGEAKSAADIRPDYYSQLKDHWPGEIIVSETGYAIRRRSRAA